MLSGRARLRRRPRNAARPPVPGIRHTVSTYPGEGVADFARVGDAVAVERAAAVKAPGPLRSVRRRLPRWPDATAIGRWNEAAAADDRDPMVTFDALATPPASGQTLLS